MSTTQLKKKRERGNIQMITMKLFFHLCFLVLLISSVTRGKNTTDVPGVKTPKVEPKENSSGDQIKNKTTVSPETEVHGKDSETPKPIPTQQFLNGSNNETTTPTAPTPSPPTVTDKTEGGPEDKEVTSAAAGTTAAPAAASSSKAGYVILVFIIIVIIILCIILYMLRRASRSYSFDLQRPAPSSRRDEPTGTFEQVYLDDLDRPVPKDIKTTDDLPTTPVANGTGPQTEDKDTSEDNVSQEQPEANGVQNSPLSSSSSSSSNDQAEQASNQLSSNNLFFDAMEEPQQQNENNNNNPSVCSSLPFVEINLDEPAWCDQFLTSPQPTSSVYPFSFSSAS